MKFKSKKLWLLYLVFYFVLISLTFFIHHHDLQHDLNCAICNWLSNFKYILPFILPVILFAVIFTFVNYFLLIFKSQIEFQSFNPRSPPL
ncbi:MAG: hypothetical protein A2145_05840 [candidate division Zixibacteria bacterium RBG_16_40_9]|nr:MAG: hypothetical protein A2145_05840 [candidate division Zixibacteria bacterium RBG_16_40_9]